MIRSSCYILLLLLLVSPWATAMKGIFWQPQLRDSNVISGQWQSLMQTLHQQGFTTLILQWTEHGTAFSNEQNRQLLQTRAITAQRAGLQVIVGLHADPDFFKQQKQPLATLSTWLDGLRTADLRQAQRWSASHEFQPDGWYISAEIDDLNWRAPDAQDALIAWLHQTRNQLAQINSQPVYISSFFAGNMSPDGYRQLLERIHATGINTWIQDGLGVNTLPQAIRQQYLDNSSGCQATPGSGIIYEIFKTQPGKIFHAQPLPAAEMKKQLAQKSACGKDRIYFSLRYLPAAQGILQY